MTCLISVGKSGKYCCVEAPHTGGELQHMDLNKGALIIKSANLPETPLLVKVGKEWTPSDYVVGGDSPCTVVCMPGCYRVDIDCSDYQGDAPLEGAVSLCIEIDKHFDCVAHALQELGAGDEEQNAAILACLAELKLLTAANNDAVALAEIIGELQALCDKLLDQSGQMDEVLASLKALCEKIEKGNQEQLDCLVAIKDLLQEKQLIPLNQVCYQ